MALDKRKAHHNSSEADLLDIFVKFHQKLVIALRKETKNLPLTISQIEALRFVVEEKNSTMKDVAEYLHITAPSATAMIEQLSDKKFITRKIDPTDRRTVHICPTPKAFELFSSFMKVKVRIFNDMLAVIGVKDKKKLASILTKLS